MVLQGLWIILQGLWKSTEYDETQCKFSDCSRDVIKYPDTTLITQENSENCYKKEVCNNKWNSEILQNLQTSHTETDGRYKDKSNIFHYNLLNAANLGVGVFAIIYASYRFYLDR